MKLDILAIGVHPDDVELACAGTILKHVAMGYKVGVVDLTSGQLGTRGTPEIRIQEAEAAAKILNLSVRVNLGMEDGFFLNDKEHQLKIIEQIRRFKPDVVLCNAINDRHPDHGRAAKLASDACFYSGLAKIETTWEGKPQEAWRPKNVYHYIQALHMKPDFVVDVSDYCDQKKEAIMAYKTQFFDPESKENDTFISSPEFMKAIEARTVEMGLIIGAAHAEGFTTQRYLGVKDITKLL